MTTDEANALEVVLFDKWVLDRRAGRTPDLDALVEPLPADRRAEFKATLTTTAALQALCGVGPAKTCEGPK